MAEFNFTGKVDDTFVVGGARARLRNMVIEDGDTVECAVLPQGAVISDCYIVVNSIPNDASITVQALYGGVELLSATELGNTQGAILGVGDVSLPEVICDGVSTLDVVIAEADFTDGDVSIVVEYTEPETSGIQKLNYK